MEENFQPSVDNQKRLNPNNERSSQSRGVEPSRYSYYLPNIRQRMDKSSSGGAKDGWYYSGAERRE